MANKFAFGLVAAGALTGICIGIGHVITESLPKAEPAVTVAPQPEAAPETREVAQVEALRREAGEALERYNDPAHDARQSAFGRAVFGN